MALIPSDTIIKLQPKELCPYRHICYFRNKPDICYGTVNRQCEFICNREDGDRWGPPIQRDQEMPAFYFTRNFHVVKSYLGNGAWRIGTQAPGPPWGKMEAPLKATALFAENGQGVGVYSPVAHKEWNYGPHGKEMSDDPLEGPCMHVAPLTRIALGPKSRYRYRYWIIVGTEQEIIESLDLLIQLYSNEKAEHTISIEAQTERHNAPGRK